MKEGRKPEYPEKTPGDELDIMLYTKARRLKPQARLEPTQQHWWQARKAEVLTVTPRVAPTPVRRNSNSATSATHARNCFDLWWNAVDSRHSNDGPLRDKQFSATDFTAAQISTDGWFDRSDVEALVDLCTEGVQA